MRPPLDPQGWQDSCQDLRQGLQSEAWPGRGPPSLRTESLLTVSNRVVAGSLSSSPPSGQHQGKE